MRAVVNAKSIPYRCRACRKHFSVRTGSLLADSQLPVRTWLLPMYLITSSRKGISSVRLAKDLGVTQGTAWRLHHKLREAYEVKHGMLGSRAPVEIDETYVGGKERNKHWDKKLAAHQDWGSETTSAYSIWRCGMSASS